MKRWCIKIVGRKDCIKTFQNIPNFIKALYYSSYRHSLRKRHVRKRLQTITLEINSIRMRNDFYRYLSWKIQSGAFDRTIINKHDDLVISTFTEESLKIIEGFISFAVQAFNKSHPMQTTTTTETIKTLQEWCDTDYEQYLREEVIDR
jgi:hypothetical protein